jgi:hypothetical protein
MVFIQSCAFAGYLSKRACASEFLEPPLLPLSVLLAGLGGIQPKPLFFEKPLGFLLLPVFHDAHLSSPARSEQMPSFSRRSKPRVFIMYDVFSVK